MDIHMDTHMYLMRTRIQATSLAPMTPMTPIGELVLTELERSECRRATTMSQQLCQLGTCTRKRFDGISLWARGGGKRDQSRDGGGAHGEGKPPDNGGNTKVLRAGRAG